MELTKKQVESLEKLATFLPDFINTIKLTLEDPTKNLSKEDMEILDKSMAVLQEQSLDYFQFKNRSGEKISIEDLEEEQNLLFQDPTFKPLIDLAENVFKGQLKDKIYTTLLPIIATKEPERELSEIINSTYLYTNWILTNHFNQEKQS